MSLDRAKIAHFFEISSDHAHTFIFRGTTRGQLLFWGWYIIFQDFRNFRSDVRDSKNFRSDFRNFRDLRVLGDFKDFEVLKYSNGFKPDIKEFMSKVRDFSDLKSGFMDFGSHFRDFRSDLKGFRPFSRDDYTSKFKVFKPDFRDFLSDFTKYRDCRDSMLDWRDCRTFVHRISEVVGPSMHHFLHLFGSNFCLHA